MYRDDYAAAQARLDTVQRELTQAQGQAVQDQQRIAMLTAQLAAAQDALARMGQYLPQYQQFMYPPRGGTILTLGILSLVLCSVLGPIAWSMGTEEMRRIDSGMTSPLGRANAQAGRICGIIGTSLLLLAGTFFLFGIVLASGH